MVERPRGRRGRAGEPADDAVELLGVAPPRTEIDTRPDRPPSGRRGWLIAGAIVVVVVGWLLVNPPEPGPGPESAPDQVDEEADAASTTSTTSPTVTTSSDRPTTERAQPEPPPGLAVIGDDVKTNSDPDYRIDTVGAGPPTGQPVAGRVLVVQSGVASVVDLATGDRSSFRPPGRPLTASTRWVVWGRNPGGRWRMTTTGCPRSTTSTRSNHYRWSRE